MPLIVEDGTMPAGANSFASLADADAYHAARLTEAWADSLPGDKKEAALIRAYGLAEPQGTLGRLQNAP